VWIDQHGKVSKVFGLIIQNQNTRKKIVLAVLELLLVYFHVKKKPFWGME